MVSRGEPLHREYDIEAAVERISKAAGNMMRTNGTDAYNGAAIADAIHEGGETDLDDLYQIIVCMALKPRYLE
jgi:hypothetical protein